MRTLIIASTLLLGSLSANAQKGLVSFNNNCNATPECVRCAEPAKWKGDKTLTEYFEAHLDAAKIDAFKALITVHATVDASGNICARSFESSDLEGTSADIMALKLDEAISQMPKWQPAGVDGHAASGDVTINVIVHRNQQRFYASSR